MSNHSRSTVSRRIEKVSEETEPDLFEIVFPLNCRKERAVERMIVLTMPAADYKSEMDLAKVSEVTNVVTKPPSKGQVTTCKSEVIYNVFALTENIEKKDILTKIVFKDVQISEPILLALAISLESQNAVEHLKFVNCNLMKYEIYGLERILEKYENITELYIDKNPYKSDNISILLDEYSTLKQLTMRLCQLDDKCVKNIAKALGRATTPLQVLNLSSNFITDLGVQYLAEALRINRSLIVLNLSNNFLTDQSCYYFSTALMRFKLNISEIRIRREENFNRLFLRRELVKRFEDQASIQAAEYRTQKGRSPRKRPPSAKSTISKADDAARDKYVNANMPKVVHPFIIDVEAKEGELICTGNFQLAHLNLAFNKISLEGCRQLHSILAYQVNQMYQIGIVGLVNLIIDGNQITNDMYEVIQEINDFLTIKNTTKSK